MKVAIVIPTHRTGIKLLENLLESFKGYNKYPILMVISDYRPKDKKLFSDIRNKFDTLPITLESIRTNSFELGGLYTAYKKTDYDEFFLLSHSCEIVNIDIFNTVFEKFRDRSVAFGLQTGNWKYALGKNDENKKFILKYLDKKTNMELINLGDIEFWQGHIGKYRRAILDKMNLLDYLPTNMIAAISKSELLFTSRYHSLDKSTIVLFPDWKDGRVFEEKSGKKRLKIMNEYIIKWKTHWNPEMVFDDMKSKSTYYKIRKFLKEKF
jgi:hypothetical protein